MRSLTVIISYSDRAQILEDLIKNVWELNPIEIIV
ncbi:glycosyl transferase, group 2, partial [Bacillus thuringiensis]|nr:glycosyl transferase, group 2 [Bacillus thuringiensis]